MTLFAVHAMLPICVDKGVLSPPHQAHFTSYKKEEKMTMRKIWVAILAACFALPFLFWSNESEAIPVFARKYGTSCATCHIGYPARNAFGEAFRNNGYRWPGGEDEDKAEIEQTPLGSESWKKVWPNAIFPADIPGIAPLALFVTGELFEYRAIDDKYKWGLPGEVEILFAATVGDNISILGDWAAGEEGVGFQLLWSLAEGVNLAFGGVGFTELFSIISATPNGEGDSYAVALPSPGNGVELRVAGGDSGGYSFIVGTGQGEGEWSDNPFDSRFIRATYKIGGSGLLSGSGGTMGNDMIGLDNAVTLGVNYFNSESGVDGEKNAVGGDIMATYGSMRAIGQIGRLIDTEVTQYSAELDYFVYPWLVGVLRYEDWGVTGEDREYTSAFIPGIGAFLRANAKLGAEYVIAEDADYNTLKVFAQLAF